MCQSYFRTSSSRLSEASASTSTTFCPPRHGRTWTARVHPLVWDLARRSGLQVGHVQQYRDDHFVVAWSDGSVAGVAPPRGLHFARVDDEGFAQSRLETERSFTIPLVSVLRCVQFPNTTAQCYSTTCLLWWLGPLRRSWCTTTSALGVVVCVGTRTSMRLVVSSG